MTNQNLTPREHPITAGETAPDFTLPDQDRKDWNLAEHLKAGDVVLCFYPMNFSPVCSTEMKCITDDLASFDKAGAQVVGISADSFYSHKAWSEAEDIGVTLLSDMHRAVCRAYGFYFEKLNVAARGTVLIGKSPTGIGKVKWVQARELSQAMDLGDVIGRLVH